MVGTTRAWAVWATLVGLAGCAGLGGQGLAGLSSNNQLLETTKALRHTIPQPAPTPRELTPEAQPTYVLEPGDGLLVETDPEDVELRVPADHTVLPDGTIDLGQYGPVIAAGKTVAEVEAVVQAVVAARNADRKVKPIDVRLTNRQSKVFYVLGEVNSPGAYPLVGSETVLRAIVTAGGLTDQASPDNIVLSRPSPPGGCRVVLPVCYRQIVQLGDTTTNYQIRNGDRVFVPSRTVCEMLGFKSKGSPCGCHPQHGCPTPHPEPAHPPVPAPVVTVAPLPLPTPVPAAKP